MSVTIWFKALNSVFWRLQVKIKYPILHVLGLCVYPHDYALQIQHKIEDYDTL